MAKTNLIDYVFITNLIDKKDCFFILQDLKNKKKDKHQWYDYSANVKNSYKNFEPDVYSADQIHTQILFPYIKKAITLYEKENVTLNSKGLISKISQIRFNFYNKNETMRTHIDHIQSLFDGQEKGIPILSIVGLLNDNYEGGEFMIRDKLIPLKAGDILIFPSCFLYPHTVKQVKKGIRNSFVCWAY